jgi:extracellular matrix regulatory protein B
LYIHLGDEMIVKTRDIIAIIDKESYISSNDMDGIIHHLKNDSGPLAKGSFKSIIVTNDQIYFSPLSSGTLKKRSQD